MRSCKLFAAAVFVTLVLWSLSFHADPGGSRIWTILSCTESLAASGRTVAKAHAKPHNSGRTQAKGSPAGSRLTSEEVGQLLASHNRPRARLGLAPLVWSNGLATYAQRWADHLAATSRRMEHRPSSGEWRQVHGENLFAGTAGYYGVTDAVAMWEQEKSAYDGERIEESNVHAYGHYTQMVWRTTKRVGCAKVTCAGKMIVVCNYDPPGNFLGQKPY